MKHILSLNRMSVLLATSATFAVFCLCPAGNARAQGSTKAVKVAGKKGYLEAFVAVDSASFYPNPDGTGTPTKITEPWLPFFVGSGGYSQEVTGNDDANGQWVQALDEQDKVLGYIRGEDILYVRKQAMWAPRQDDPRHLSNIHAKALMVTKYEDYSEERRLIVEKDRVEGTDLVVVKAYHGPSLKNSTVSDKVAIHRQRFVWKTLVRDDEINPNEKVTWYLLGTKSEVGDFVDAANWIEGWVPGWQIYQWNTSQGVEFDHETRKSRLEQAKSQGIKASADELERHQGAARVFYDDPTKAQDDTLAVDYATSGVIMLPPSVMSTEDMRAEGPLKKELSRFPLIKATPIPGSINQVYEIGWIGDFYGPNGRPVISKEAQEEANAQIQDMLRGELQLDVVIVLDGTASMRAYKDEAKLAIASVIRQVKAERPKHAPKDAELKTRCAIAVYRNKDDPESGEAPRFQYLSFQELPSGQQAINDFLDGLKFTSVSPHPAEAVFDGVLNAARRAEADSAGNPHAYRMMIVVGDAGDESADTTLEGASKALQDKRFDFCALSVTSRSDTTQTYVDFRTQMQGLAKNNLRAAKSVPGYNGADRLIHLSNQKDFVSKIQKAYHEGVETRNLISDVIHDPERYPNEIQEGGFVWSVMTQQKGINPAALSAEKVQLFGKGITTAHGFYGQQWKVMHLVKKDALLGCVAALEPFEQFIVSGVRVNASASHIEPKQIDELKDSLMASFKIKSAEDQSKSLEQVLGDQGEDIPVNSSLLKKSLGELLKFLQEPGQEVVRERGLELRRIGICCKILRAIAQGRAWEPRMESAASPGGSSSLLMRDIFIHPADQKDDRWFLLDQLEYAWIPFEYFP